MAILERRCEHCGREIPEVAKFCPYCGVELDADVKLWRENAHEFRIAERSRTEEQGFFESQSKQKQEEAEKFCEFWYDDNVYNEYLYLMARLALARCNQDIEDFDLWIRKQSLVRDFFDSHGADVSRGDFHEETTGVYSGKYDTSYRFLRGRGVNAFRRFRQYIQPGEEGIILRYGPSMNPLHSVIFTWSDFDFVMDSEKLILLCQYIPDGIMGNATKTASLNYNAVSRSRYAHWYKMDPLIKRSVKQDDVVILKDGIKDMSPENLLAEIRRHVDVFYDWRGV